MTMSIPCALANTGSLLVSWRLDSLLEFVLSAGYTQRSRWNAPFESTTTESCSESKYETFASAGSKTSVSAHIYWIIVRNKCAQNSVNLTRQPNKRTFSIVSSVDLVDKIPPTRMNAIKMQNLFWCVSKVVFFSPFHLTSKSPEN